MEKKRVVKIVCLVPALPGEVRLDTLQSIFNQTVPVSCTILLTEKVSKRLAFPAKISLVMNRMLDDLRLENFDYLLRVDADTVLPANFIEGNLDFDIVGYGPAQLIRVPPFFRCMGGRFHCEHDDGYPLVKFRQCGFRSSVNYVVAPLIQRVSGKHQGCGWYVGQGELHYRYGYDPLGELLVVLYKWRQYHPYGLFYLVGYFKALFSRKKRFDVAELILWQHLSKYRQPFKFIKFYKYKTKILRGLRNGF